MSIRISRVNQTCEKNPSQWEGLTDDGTHIYVRYRWGCLSIGSGKTLDEAVANASNFFEKSFGDKRDGYLEYEKLREVTAGVIDWLEQHLVPMDGFRVYQAFAKEMVYSRRIPDLD